MKDSEFAFCIRVGSLLGELGPKATSSAEILRSVFNCAGDAIRSMTMHGLVYLLFVAAEREDNLPAGSVHAYEPRE